MHAQMPCLPVDGYVPVAHLACWQLLEHGAEETISKFIITFRKADKQWFRRHAFEPTPLHAGLPWFSNQI